jgi:hypothetical protein
MSEIGLAQRLAFLVAQRHEDEDSLLTQAIREGIQTLYRETLIEAYLLGRVSREALVKEIGPEQLEEVEYQRDALQRDVAWGLQNA